MENTNRNEQQNTSIQWTPSQQQVIDLRNRSLLVSAAAGSGKTAVLVQRIVSMVTDPVNPIDIDQLLVVTFTNAAASEMSERVLKAIEKEALVQPENMHLQRQMNLIHNAQITTIDSFCLSVIRDHFHEIDLEPGFRIGDEGELKLMREDVCDAVLETCYQERKPEFLKFIDSYSTAKSDDAVREMILKLYTYAQSYPWPDEWLDACENQYQVDSEAELEAKPWMQSYMEYMKVRLTELVAQYEEVYAYTLQDDGPTVYEGVVKDDLRHLQKIQECISISEWRDFFLNISFQNLPRAMKYQGSEAKKAAVTNTRDQIKKEIKQYAEIFKYDLTGQIDLLKKTGDMIKVLVAMTKIFTSRFEEAKKKKNILDFSDVEHKALAVLMDSETKQPTATAFEYRQQFAEIMIDEYQDSNYVQEAILTSVSRIPEKKENLFMVGDVKQSIYRFRLARPELFMEKYNRFSTDDSLQQRIDLHQNFRSRKEIVDVVNDIFYKIMGKDLGNVEYDAEAALYQGASYEEYENPDCCKPEFIILTETSDYMDKKEAEARMVANRIRELVEHQEIPGKQYKDMVILLRSLSGWAEAFQSVFEEEGIPLIVSSRTGYFAAQEVQTILAMLRIIDNPEQDIPLAAVMKSQIGGFSASELSLIKAAFPDQTFYQCVQQYTGLEQIPETDLTQQQRNCLNLDLIQKLQNFWDELNIYRNMVPYTPTHILLQKIYDNTGYRNYVTALPAGEQRRANLDVLLEKAIAYEKTSYHGVFHFVRYIDRLIKYDMDYGEAEIVTDQDNAVRLMSIHKSKGLEFPVVFVAGMGKTFNMQDVRSSMVFHPDYGVGLKWVDIDRRVKSDTLVRSIFALEGKKETLGEELRVLYVALTRAKEKLLLVGSYKDPEEITISPSPSKRPFSERMDAKCYWDWVLPAVLSYGGKYELHTCGLTECVLDELEKECTLQEKKQILTQELKNVDEELYQEIQARLSWKYPYQETVIVKQKVSVSELKHRQIEKVTALEEGIDHAEAFPAEDIIPYVPEFIQKTEVNRGALRGTAFHRFMECISYENLPSFTDWHQGKEYLMAAGNQFVDAGLMVQEDLELLDYYKIYQFLIQPVARRMSLSAQRSTLVKEQPFVMSIPANMVHEAASARDQVLVQGIIDVFWEEEDGIVLLDYKTDNVPYLEKLSELYSVQLHLYKDAIERNFQKKVKEILIYSFKYDTILKL